MSTEMFRVTDLSAGYGQANIVSSIDLQIQAGEVVSVVGANGAGKTTLVKALCGLLPTRTGNILLKRKDISGLPAHKRVQNGLVAVLEGRHLFGELTVEDTFRLAASIGSKGKADVAQFSRDDVAELFPILHEKAKVPVGVLSGGQQQMVAISKALLLQPDLLVLDELSTGLAPRLLEDILAVLTQLKVGGMSMLLIEQSVGVAEEVSDRAYVMELGKVVMAGSWDDLNSDGGLVRAYLGG